jgi:tetrachlorobenzoquinone reductase
LPGGLRRSYSLINAQSERHRFVIAVNRDPASRGGSRYVCDVLRPGEVIEASAPSNNFSLKEDAALSVLIAGGIGITPLWGMIQRLETLGRAWKLYYAARTRSRAAFLTQFMTLEAASAGRVTVTFDHEPGQAMLNLPRIIASQPDGTHFYCCGPVGMLKAFEEACASVPPDAVHVEYFSSDVAPAQGGFDVVLSSSGKTIAVKPGETILEALLAAGVSVGNSCREGVCGTCETGVLEGIPDHRDKVLSRRERASNKKIMICCSGAQSNRLVLDL